MTDSNHNTYEDVSTKDSELISAELRKINLIRVVLAVLKRPYVVFITALIVIIPTIYYLMENVPYFRSSSTIMVSVKGGTLFQGVDISAQYTDLYSTGKTMKYYTSILDSRIYKNLVKTDIFNYFPETLKDSISYLFDNSSFSYTRNPREEGFLNIFATSANREFAYILSKIALDDFRSRSIELEREEAQNIVNFVDEQISQLNLKLEKAEDDLQKFVSERKLIIENSDMGVSNQLIELEKQLSEAQAQFEMVQINIDSYQRKIGSLLDELTANYPKQSESRIMELKSKLAQKKQELDNSINSNLTSSEVLNIYNEMNDLRNELVSASAKTSALNEYDGENSKLSLQKLEDELETALFEREKSVNQVKFYQWQIEQFKNEHPNLAKDILDFASLIRAKEVLKRTVDILLTKREESRIRLASEQGGIKVIDEPNLPRRPIPARKVQKLILAILGSLVLGVVIAVIIDFFDTTIKDENDVIKFFHLPVFGTLPILATDHRGRKIKPGHKSSHRSISAHEKKLLNEYSEKSPVAEAYRSLKTSIQFIAQDKGKKIFVISSPSSTEGKSLCSINLGISFAQGGQKTLVIDCDLRRPVQHKYFDYERKPGLSDHLFGEADLSEIIKPTPVHNLDLISAGTSPPNPAEMIASRIMKNFLKDIRQKYDIVIIDTPPILACVDSRILAQAADGMIIVIKVESTKLHDLDHAISLTHRVNADIVGVILNQVEFRYGYTYYYAYRYYNPYSYYYGSYNYYYYYDMEEGEKVRRRRKKLGEEAEDQIDREL